MQLQVWREAAHEHANGSGDVFPRSELETHEIGPCVNQHAWWSRYSAPGYMDKTDTCGPYRNSVDAAIGSFEMHGEVGDGAVLSTDEEDLINALIEGGLTEDEARARVALVTR